MAQIGNILREARIRKGWSLKDVSDVTKVRTKYLEALEQNDFHVIPGSTFVKAYLRTYASLLRLDADALVEEYRSTYERGKDDSGEYYDQTAERARSRSLTRQKSKTMKRTRRGYTVIGVVAIVAVVLLAWFGSNRGQPAATLDPDSVGGSVTTTMAGGGSTGTTETTVGEESTTTSSEIVATGGDVDLRIRVADNESCFLKVHEDNRDGRELFSGTATSGQELEWFVAKRYWLQVGLPDVIRVFANDMELVIEGEGGFFIVTETEIKPTDE